MSESETRRVILPEEYEKILVALHAADERKAERPLLYDVTGRETYTDYILICHGTSDRHVGAIQERIARAMKKHGHRAIGVEGEDLNHWVLMDYGGLIVNIFYEPMRDFYDLDGLWMGSPELDVAELLREAESRFGTPPASEEMDRT